MALSETFGESAGLPERILIPSIGVDTAIVVMPRVQTSWDATHLTWQAGHMETTALPGQGGNVVLGAHRYLKSGTSQPGPFARLGEIQCRDRIQVHTAAQAYTYEVTNVLRVDPTDVWVIGPTGGEMLTLLTCDTYNPATGRFMKRLVVRARLVEGAQ